MTGADSPVLALLHDEAFMRAIGHTHEAIRNLTRRPATAAVVENRL